MSNTILTLKNKCVCENKNRKKVQIILFFINGIEANLKFVFNLVLL